MERRWRQLRCLGKSQSKTIRLNICEVTSGQCAERKGNVVKNIQVVKFPENLMAQVMMLCDGKTLADCKR